MCLESVRRSGRTIQGWAQVGVQGDSEESDKMFASPDHTGVSLHTLSG